MESLAAGGLRVVCAAASGVTGGGGVPEAVDTEHTGCRLGVAAQTVELE